MAIPERSGSGNDEVPRSRTAQGEPGQHAGRGEQRSRAMGNRDSRVSVEEGGEDEIPTIQVSPELEDGACTLPETPGTKSGSQIHTGLMETGVKPGSQSVPSNLAVLDVAWHQDDSDEGRSQTGSEDGGSVRCSRVRFLQVMKDSSLQVRRGLTILPPRADSDHDSLGEEERTPAALDPLEHEWMMCSSDGEWDNLTRLLDQDPQLIQRKDFVTGFTCLHWAAKHGRPELLVQILTAAERHCIDVSVNGRTSAGYTPLHLAAMQGHLDVLKLLVGAYNADVNVRDFSGRKACHYLNKSTGGDIQDIIADDEAPDAPTGESGHPARPHSSYMDRGAQLRGSVFLRRRSSFSSMRPKLQRLRARASQLVHRSSFRDTPEPGGAPPGPDTLL
ncbi:Ankyrin repeat domain-containing protein SOWAHC [Oryzias melastigma]|uniref:Ankyrin repeat domain-containing protein SOWAHC n=1 Tax=Oryzias melastigma TaxID=30732 RepID=A0A834KXJ2_ORYME|nr:Ankyrin repeat domain-containing protein SOWAHC [Oryzias melastigma]